nr:hypothetical protein CFP56_62591 [Quercus suber]
MVMKRAYIGGTRKDYKEKEDRDGNVEVQSYKLDIVMVAAVCNTIGTSKVAFMKRLDSTSSVVSCKLAKCENECNDEDEQANYLCC